MDSNYVQVSDDELIAALDRSPRFTRVQDGAHLAYLLDVDEDEKAPSHPNGWADIEAATAALKAPAREEDLTLTVEEAKALPKSDTYEVGQRIIMVNLPHLGATIRSLDEMGVGLDYDNDEPDDAYEAMYAHIRPMPLP